MQLTKNIKEYPFLFIIALMTFAGAIGWQVSTYPMTDDWSYMCQVTQPDEEAFWHSEGPLVETFKDAFNSTINHFHYINCRLANALFIFAQLTPRWIQSGICGLAIGCMFLGLLLCGCGLKKMRSVPCLMSAVVLLWCAFPWYNTMQSTDFQFNYSLPSAMWLAYMYLLPKYRTMSRQGSVLFALYAFISGLMHETFTCVMIAYTFIVWLQNGLRSRRTIALLVLLCVSVVWGFLWSNSIRTGMFLGHRAYSGFWMPLTQLASQLWPLWLALVLLATACLRLRNSRILLESLPYLCGCAVGIAIVCILGVLDRGLFPVHLLACVLCLKSIALLSAPEGRSTRYIWIGAGAVFSILYALWLVKLVETQLETSREIETLDTMLKASGRNVPDYAYMNMSCPWDYPPYLMDITSNQLKVTDNDNFHLASFHAKSRKWVAILPPEFEGMEYDKLPEIPGNNSLRGVWPVMLSNKRSKPLVIANFGVQMPTAKLTDRILAAAKTRSFRADSASQEMPVAYQPLIVSESGNDTIFLVTPALKVRTNQRREFISIDTIPSAR